MNKAQTLSMHSPQSKKGEDASEDGSEDGSEDEVNSHVGSG